MRNNYLNPVLPHTFQGSSVKEKLTLKVTIKNIFGWCWVAVIKGNLVAGSGPRYVSAYITIGY